jgi:mono/diheme cytochrome c family protein
MPSFAWKLNDEQAAAVLTNVHNSWGSSAGAVEAEQVRRLRAAFVGRASRQERTDC